MNGASISPGISNFLVPHFSTRSSTASSSKLVPYFDMASLRVKTKGSIRHESNLQQCDLFGERYVISGLDKSSVRTPGTTIKRCWATTSKGLVARRTTKSSTSISKNISNNCFDTLAL